MYNNSYMKMGRYNRIVHFISNGAMIDNLSEHVEYVNKLRKIAEISMTNASDHCVLVGDKCNHITLKSNLKSVSEMNFEFAVIWFEGSWPLSGEFEENLLMACDEWSYNTNWLAAGHIIDKRPDTEMPGFDPQCVVINLKSYQSLNYPTLKTRKTSHSPMYESSAEHIHDDYTPMYLEPTDKFSDSKEQGNGFLDALIHMALSNEMYVHNLPHSVRDEKYCCYPEDDIGETKEWLDLDFTTKSLLEIRKISDKISEDKEELFAYKYMDKIILYITNTESVPKKDTVVYKHNVMTCPASGLHQFMHMINARDTLERVIWTDFSEAALWWVEFLITNWDGKDFIDFYKSHKHHIHDVYHIDDETILYDEELIHGFIEEVGDSWLDDWAHIQSLDHTFMKINMVTEWKRLVDTIGNDNTVFLQVSNIWQYEINYINTTHFQAQTAYINLMNEVMNNNKDLFVTGDTPAGTYQEYQNMKEIVSIN
jgi:hypothetical protein